MEDSAAVAGVFIAAAALGLAHYTGSTVYDSMGSIAIGGNACGLRKTSILAFFHSSVVLENPVTSDENQVVGWEQC